MFDFILLTTEAESELIKLKRYSSLGLWYVFVWRDTHPLRDVTEGAGRGLQQAGAPVGGALEPETQKHTNDVT